VATGQRPDRVTGAGARVVSRLTLLYSRAPIARPPAMSSSGRGRGTAPDGFDAQSRANAHAAARQGSAGLRYLARLRRSGAALSAVEEASRVPQLSLPRVPVVAGLTCAAGIWWADGQDRPGGTGVTSLNCRTGVSQWPSAMRRVTGPQQHRPCGSCVPCCAAAPTMARSLSGPRPYGRPGPRLRHGADSYCLTRPAGDGRARSSPAVCQRRTPSAATDRTRWDRSLPRPGRLQSHWRADDGAATQARSRRRAFGPPPTAARQRRRRSSAPNWRCAWRTGSPEPRTTAMPCIACLAATGPQMSTSPPLPGDACLWSRMRCCLAPLKLPPLSVYLTRTCRGRYTEVVEPPGATTPLSLAAAARCTSPAAKAASLLR